MGTHVGKTLERLVGWLGWKGSLLHDDLPKALPGLRSPAELDACCIVQSDKMFKTPWLRDAKSTPPQNKERLVRTYCSGPDPNQHQGWQKCSTNTHTYT